MAGDNIQSIPFWKNFTVINPPYENDIIRPAPPSGKKRSISIQSAIDSFLIDGNLHHFGLLADTDWHTFANKLRKAKTSNRFIDYDRDSSLILSIQYHLDRIPIPIKIIDTTLTEDVEEICNVYGWENILQLYNKNCFYRDQSAEEKMEDNTASEEEQVNNSQSDESEWESDWVD